jgi:hypothetical protein
LSLARARVNSNVMRLILVIALMLSLTGYSLGRISSTSQGGYGTFRGVIMDDKGKPLRGASVTVLGSDLKHPVKPNRWGYFEIVIPVGTYDITVKKSGFAPYTLKGLEVKRNEDSEHIFRLGSSRIQSSIHGLLRRSPGDA